MGKLDRYLEVFGDPEGYKILGKHDFETGSFDPGQVTEYIGHSNLLRYVIIGEGTTPGRLDETTIQNFINDLHPHSVKFELSEEGRFQAAVLALIIEAEEVTHKAEA